MHEEFLLSLACPKESNKENASVSDWLCGWLYSIFCPETRDTLWNFNIFFVL